MFWTRMKRTAGMLSRNTCHTLRVGAKHRGTVCRLLYLRVSQTNESLPPLPQENGGHPSKVFYGLVSQVHVPSEITPTGSPSTGPTGVVNHDRRSHDKRFTKSQYHQLIRRPPLRFPGQTGSDLQVEGQDDSQTHCLQQHGC